MSGANDADAVRQAKIELAAALRWASRLGYQSGQKVDLVSLWDDGIERKVEGFTLLAANELFDAIPIRQFVKTPNGFRERMVGLDENDELCFTLGVATLDPAMLPHGISQPPDGEIFEVAPARQSVMLTICERLIAHHGSALIIDYGHMVSNFGDTLQAVRAHEYDPPLAHPGLADLTSHVDFENLARTALAAGVHLNGCMHQGDFLVGLGIDGSIASWPTVIFVFGLLLMGVLVVRKFRSRPPTKMGRTD
mgnify:CR=1 FL=1